MNTIVCTLVINGFGCHERRSFVFHVISFTERNCRKRCYLLNLIDVSVRDQISLNLLQNTMIGVYLSRTGNNDTVN